MDFTQAHRALGAHREHSTTEALSDQKTAAERNTRRAGASATLDAVEGVRA